MFNYLFLFLCLFGHTKQISVDYAIYANKVFVAGERGNLELTNKYILIKDKKISAIVTEKELSQYEVNETIKLNRPTLVLPGFANTHTHVAMYELRGKFGNFDIIKWWEQDMKPYENTYLTKESVYKNSVLGIKELLSGGTTLINDMFVFSDEVIKAAQKTGIRGVFGETLYTDRGPKFMSWKDSIALYSKNYKKFKNSPQIKISLSPHGIFSINNKLMASTLDLAKKNKSLFHIHLNETPMDNKVMMKRAKKSALDGLIQLGLDDKVDTLFAHGGENKKNEIKKFKKIHGSFSMNFLSNMLLGAKLPDFDILKESSQYLTLGTDSVASNPYQDMRYELSAVFNYYRYQNKKEAQAFAKELIKISTYNGYKALGFTQGGSIAKGNHADLQVYILEKGHTPITQKDFILNQKNYKLKNLFILGKSISI